MGVIVLAGVFVTAPAHAASVGVFTQPEAAPAYATNGIGLLVPGRGPTVSREEALDALEGLGPPDCPCDYAILIRLPEAKHANDRRYAITIAGRGYDGMLVSDRTKVPGLISIYDVEPTVRALERGEQPPITSERVASPRERLDALEARLQDLDNSRMAASLGVAALIGGFALVAAVRRSVFFGRAALLVIPASLATALALSALDATNPWALIVIAAAGALALARLTRHPYALAAALLAIFPLYLVVLAVSQETSSLAMIGPRPENGGRFYGFNNQLETLALVPAFLGAALLGPRVLPLVAALAVVTVGATFAGADGGGVIVLLAGFLFLWLRLRDIPLTARNLVIAGAAVVVLGIALVLLDTALGGESHVTRSLSGGPAQVAEDVADRLVASAEGVVSSWHAAVVVALSIPALAWLALRRPRYAVLDALLVALAVSLVVNDAPREVCGYGALSAFALRSWCEARGRLE